MQNRHFQLFLFSVDSSRVRSAQQAGIDGILVDWERRGKPERQAGFDTQINADTYEDLARVRAEFTGIIVCRINAIHSGSGEEIERAIAGGADEILIPMVREPEEVRFARELARDRAAIGILVETESALRRIDEFAELPLARLYIGLNDLAIERGETNIFRFLLEDRLSEIRRKFSCPFGFGGLTLARKGFPLPCRLLMGELARIQGNFSFLRRSFLRDVPAQEFPAAVAEIRTALAAQFSRPETSIQSDKGELFEAIRNLSAS